MYNFTPISAFLGGLIIGSSVLIFFFTTGRLAGISGIFAETLTNKKNRFSNLLFLLGLVIGPFIYSTLSYKKISFQITDSFILIIIAGFLVGLGTRMSGGCTSGHGICGISRLSIRSILATIIFIFTGMLTVFIFQKLDLY